MIDLQILARLPQERAELSAEQSLPLAKEDGLRIAATVFGIEALEECLLDLNRAEITYRTVANGGRYIDEHPGLIFDPPLAVGELVSVVLEDNSAHGGVIAWREFPRVLKPTPVAAPEAMVMKHPFHFRLSEPVPI